MKPSAKSTLWFFLGYFGLLLALPFFFTLFFLVGSVKMGLPFVYYHSSSAPPPDFGSKWEFEMLLLDLVFCLGLAMGSAWLMARWKSRKRAR